jgi:hypothetical protein
MPEETSSDTGDLFGIICSTRSMRRLKTDPVPDAVVRKVSDSPAA